MIGGGHVRRLNLTAKKIHLRPPHNNNLEIDMATGKNIDVNCEVIADNLQARNLTINRLIQTDASSKLFSLDAGTTGDVLQDDGDGTFSWTNPSNTTLTYSVNADNSTLDGSPSDSYNNTQNITFSVLKVPNQLGNDATINGSNFDGSASQTWSVVKVPNAISVSSTLSGTSYDGSSAVSDWAVVYGTSGTSACVGNDSRLSDDRPNPNSISVSSTLSGTSYDGNSAVSDWAVVYGTSSTSACRGDDARLSDTRANPNAISVSTTLSGTSYDGSSAVSNWAVVKVPNALTAGTNISFSSGTTYDGSAAITISSTDTNTTYSASDGVELDGTNIEINHSYANTWSILQTMKGVNIDSQGATTDAKLNFLINGSSKQIVSVDDAVPQTLKFSDVTSGDDILKVDGSNGYIETPKILINSALNVAASLIFRENSVDKWLIQHSAATDQLVFYDDVNNRAAGYFDVVSQNSFNIINVAGEARLAIRSLLNNDAKIYLYENGVEKWNFGHDQSSDDFVITDSVGTQLQVASSEVKVGRLLGEAGYPTIGKLVITNTGVSSVNLEFRSDDSTIYPKDYPTTNIKCGFTSTSWDDAYFTIQTHGDNTSSFTDDLVVKGGLVGINTATPSARLHVVDRNARFYLESDRQAGRIYQFASSGTNGEGFDFRDLYHNKRVWLYYNNSYQLWDMNGTEQMRLTTTGLGIKKTASGYELDINGDGRAVSFVETSDERVKTNIKDYPSSTCLDVIQSIPIKKYDYIDGFNNGNKDVVGFLANDLVDNPELKGVVKKHDEYVIGQGGDDAPDELVYKDFLGVAKPRLIAFLIGAVQELQKQVNDLKKEMVNLKS